MIIEESMQSALNKRTRLGHIRRLSQPIDAIDFCSNDYLGFSRSSCMHEDFLREWDSMYAEYHRLGSTGSRLLCGNTSYAEDLEKTIAQFHQAESALIFNSGYDANSGLLQTILTAESRVIYDLHVHASMHEGIKKSRATPLPFHHQDLEHLEKRLQHASKPAFVCVEAIYSLDGKTAPLREICQLCEKYSARLIVDEAHSTGILGEHGEGLTCHLGLQDRVFARVHTFGKALGTQGAAVLGSSLLREYLINFCPTFIYTTSLPLFSLAAIRCAYRRLPIAKTERARLQELYHHFILKSNLSTPAHHFSPIIPISIKGGNFAAKAFSQKLRLMGFDLRPILSPTVRRGNECLRMCLHAYNNTQEVEALCAAINLLMEQDA